jgi:hypothetical protein
MLTVYNRKLNEKKSSSGREFFYVEEVMGGRVKQLLKLMAGKRNAQPPASCG